MLSGNRIPDRSHEHYGYSLAIVKVFWHVEGEAFVVSRRRRWNGGEPWLAQPGPYFFEEIGERTPGDFAPWTPAGERVSFPHTPFLWTGVKAAWFFYRPTWPAASKTTASWPAHQLGRAGEVVYCREEKVGTRTVTLCLFPKGTDLRPQPAQPVGGPLRAFRCEGRRPGNK